jgi:hypothetical protein
MKSAIPCTHGLDSHVGTVEAGDPKATAHCSVRTCPACVLKSQGYVQMVTGQPAKPLLTFTEARQRKQAIL